LQNQVRRGGLGSCNAQLLLLCRHHGSAVTYIWRGGCYK
jgi:hypothetical protein